MSLNGLDDAAVVGAYQAAISDAGGWLLLRYATRDTVELLSKGNGGVAEARGAIEAYETKSPIFGLVQYRRRKVVIKYVPEGTSRLLQARLAVHIQNVVEAFSPNENVFPMTAADQLTEAALSSGCMLHASVGSLTSDSSSSLRRQRLGGITEDEEPGNVPKESHSETVASAAENKDKTPAAGAMLLPEIRTSGPVLELPDEEGDTAPASPRIITNVPPRTDSLSQPIPSSTASSLRNSASPRLPSLEIASPSLPSFEKPMPEPPKRTAPKPPPEAEPPAHRPVLQKDDKSYESKSRISQDTRRPSYEPRQSSQSLRPSEIDASSLYGGYSSYKPKKKLGPRPHVNPPGRPQTSGSGNQGQRLVANLPQSIRPTYRPVSTALYRPGSQHSTKSVPSNFRHRSEVPTETPPIPDISALYNSPNVDRFFSKSPAATPTPSAIAPEKLRLMKALQLRKRQQIQAQRMSQVAAAPDPVTNFVMEGDGKELRETDIQTTDGPELASPDPQPDLISATEDHDTKANFLATRVSPISLPELSEPPSTQGSSFTDVHDHQTTDSETTQQEGHSSGRSSGDENDGSNAPTVKVTPTSSSIPGDPADGAPLVSPSRPPEVPKDLDAKRAHISTQFDASKLAKDNHVSTDSALHMSDEMHKTAEPQIAAPLQASESATASMGKATPTPEFDDAVHGKDRQPPASINGVTPSSPLVLARALAPVKILSSPEPSEISDDEGLDYELEHAKIEEAKPISVARSPITPIFSKGSSNHFHEVSHTASGLSQQQSDSTRTTPERRNRSGRSLSTALPQWQPPTDGTPALVAKKGTSSGISTRIKALELFSRRDSNATSPETHQQNTPAKSPSGFSPFRKRSSIAPVSRVPSTSTTTAPPKQAHPPAPVPLSEQPANLPFRSWAQKTDSATKNDTPVTKGNSISVTARIIRDSEGNNERSSSSDGAEPRVVNMHRSPLIVERERKEPNATMLLPDVFEDAHTDALATSSKAERPRFSFSSNRTSAPRLPTSDSMASRMSQASSRKKKDSGTIPRSASDNSSFTDEKSKSSRTGRLMKRMSTLTGGSRSRNLISTLSPTNKAPPPPTPIAEQLESQMERPFIGESISHVVDIGDVNVQFPDTLLWKRRFIRIDDQGYLILTPPAKETMEKIRGVSRRFHLSEFKRPTLPDPEREELPWSIVLDFQDGSCLQCACESRYAQNQVLGMLVDAHSAYHQLYMRAA